MSTTSQDTGFNPFETSDLGDSALLSGSSSSFSSTKEGTTGKTYDMAKLTNLGTQSTASVNMDILDFIMDNRPPEETRAIYNMWASSYDEDMTAQAYKAPVIASAYVEEKLKIPKTANVLDVGCGTGLVGAALHKMSYTNIDGVDISEEMMNEAKKKGCYINRFLDKIIPNTKIELGDGQYDCAILCGSLIPGHISPKSLGVITDLIKSSGYLLCLGPAIALSAKKSKEFETQFFLQTIEDLSKNNNIKLLERSTVDEYRHNTQGELFCFQKE